MANSKTILRGSSNYKPWQRTTLSVNPTPSIMSKPVANQTSYDARFPWLNETSYKKMESEVNKMGLSWTEREDAMNDWYRNNVTYLLNDQTLQERDTYLNEQAYQAANLQDPQAYAQYRMEDAVQKAKKLWNLDATANDLDVFADIVGSLPNGNQLAWEYLSWQNKDLLYEAWILEKIEAPETPEPTVWGMQSIINKQSEIPTDSALGRVNAALDWANLPWKVTQWVDGMVQKIPVITWEQQVKNLANKLNNLSDEEIQGLYNRYVEMIKNWTDEKWKNDDRNWWALFWDAMTWDKDALDRVNTLHLYDYSGIADQNGIQRNKRWNQLLEKLGAWEMNEDMDAAYNRVDNLDTNKVVKWLAKASIWTADKTKNLLNLIWGAYGSLQNYAEALWVWMQELDDIRDNRFASTEWLEYNDDAFMEYVADRTANFGEYMLDAPDTILWKPVTPNAVKFISNIPWSFIKTVSAQVRWKTNQLDSKIWLAKLLFTEEWQQAIFDRYGTPEAFANSINTDPIGTADDLIDLADKFSWFVNNVSWGGERERIGSLMDAVSDWIVNGKWTVEINWKNYNVYGINQWLTRVSDWLWDNWYKRTANLVNLERDISTDTRKIKEDAKEIANQWAEDLWAATRYIYDEAWNIVWTMKDLANNAAFKAWEITRDIADAPWKAKDAIVNAKDNVVESVATRMAWSKTAQDKLFQAQEPTLNRLSKERNTWQIKNKSDVANELIVKDIEKNWWSLPTDTQTRVDAHERAMKNIWAEIEAWIKDKKWYEINANDIADVLDAYIKKEESYGISKSKSDLEALKEQSQEIRKMGTIDIVKLEGMKERINAQINDWDDKSVGNTYKNWMREVTQKMWALEDSVIARIPWEFQDLKNDFGALADWLWDVVKANVKAQRAKYSDSISNYSRIKWIGDIIKWVWHGDLWDASKWVAQVVWGEVTAKLKDKDWLIEQWFKDLSEEMKSPEFKSAKNNLAWRPKNEANLDANIQAKNDKTVSNLLKAWKKKK